MLKVLMLKKKRDDAQKQLDELRKKAEAFSTRETELEADIAEAQTEEEKTAVEEAITAFDTEKAENEKETQRLSDLVEQYDKEIAETEEKANTPAPEDSEARARKEIPTMEMTITTTRAREMFGKMTSEQRSAMFAQDDVKSFMEQVRTCMAEKRALTNVGLTIPKVYLGLIRENIERYSKLYKHVYVRPLSGEGRMTIMGGLPEAVWTEMCANLNELDLSWYQTEVDGYKVGGYIPVCNATLEDSDVELAAEIITALGQGIGKALDKGILYGKGTKMPLGIVTRLVQTNPPENLPATAMPWIDLHETNVKAINAALEGGTIESDYCGTMAEGYVALTELNAKVAAAGTKEKLDEVKQKLMKGEIKVFDTDTFTVGGKKLDSYTADIVDNGDFVPDSEAVKDGAFAESTDRSAPYFDIKYIDGISE